MTLGRKYQQSSGNAVDARKVYASQSKVGTLSGCSSSISLCDMIEPPDWEEVADRLLGERDPLAYPNNDIEVVTLPKKIRTIGHVLPDEDLSKAPLFVRDCIRTYTSNYTVVEHKFRQHSASTFCRERLAERLERLHAAPRHQYEVDEDVEPTPEESKECENQSSGRQSVASMSSSSSCNETLTPRGSWASLDLRSSSSDPLLPEIFEKKPLEQIDAMNEARRMENRHSDLMGLYTPFLEEDEPVERRLPAELPCEVTGHRIHVMCHQLKLELDVEPIFASMALYDAREKKKLSENFYFNLNPELTKQMLAPHIGAADVSTLSRSAVFDILNPSHDIFIVVRLEKVLQGDVNECVEPYIKDDKNREKVRACAQAACSRLGKFRMPFAWTAVSLAHVISGSNSLEREQDKDNLSVSSQNSNSLDRKASTSSLEQLRRRANEVGGSLTRKGSVERRAPPIDDLAALLDGLKPIGITLTSFFKQEPDKLRDEDLYKFLAEIKRPSSAPKKLKCIPGVLKIEVAPCPEEIRNGLTPELAKLHPYGDDSTRPCREVLPFPVVGGVTPHHQYRGLLYVSPRDLNLAAYASRAGSARNIAVRVQLMSGEEQVSALPAIFGRSCCPEFSTEAYTTVLYHNKTPTFYDEIKLKLPADLGAQHHLLFTVIHVACQRKPVAPDHEKNLETVIGYTWLPLCSGGKLTCGEFMLPVMTEEPPANYSYIFPDVLLPGTKWIDNHKPIFTVTLDAHTTVHPLDSNIERFAMACEAVLEGNIPARIGVANMEAELRTSIHELPTANVEILSRYLPVVLDRLLQLLVAPPSLQGQTLNIAQDVFTCLTQIFTDITNMNEGSTCDAHSRSSLLGAYIQYQANIPRPAFPDSDVGLPLPPNVMMDGSCKVLHEELALQWVVASGATRDLAMHNSWALFELMLKSMVSFVWWGGALDGPRRSRFPDHYTDDLTTLVNNVTAEIISRYGKNSRLTQSLNNSLAFFLFDLLSVADRGYVLTLIKTYCKQMSAKIASLPDAVPLQQYKLSFLRIICSHEHYVSLNMPWADAAPSSPAPSLRSAASGVSSAGGAALTLGHEYRARHYLAGLLLSELAAVLDMQSPVLQSAGVSALVCILSSHDADPRLPAELKTRVAALYLPLVSIVLDAYPMLYKGFEQAKDVLQFEGDMGQFEHLFAVTSPRTEYPQATRAPLNSETSRALLVSLCWVLRFAARGTLVQAFADLPQQRIATLLRVIAVAFSSTEYKGRKELMKCSQQNVRKTSDIKAKLEDVILGQGSARSDFIMRRKGAPVYGERWRKGGVRGRPPAAPCPALPAALAAELAVTLTHALELIVQSCSQYDYGQAVCSAALQVLLQAMHRNQSSTVLQHMMATLRSFVIKLGACGAALVGGACGAVVRGAAGRGGARPHAAAALYALMRHHYHLHNFSRVKMQVTMSLSSLVGTSTTFSEESLRRALKTILLYAEKDQELQDTAFPEQVKDLIFNLHMILSDTVKMKEFQEDPEMLLDLMHRIARGYQHSPDLRLTWLNNMAQKHMERNNHTEAGMCLSHGAALRAEVSCLRGRGAALLLPVTLNALDESCADCSVTGHTDHREIQALLEHAASELMSAGMYETVNEVYKVLIPIAEENRDYKKLANIHSKLNEAFTRIEQLHGKRVFGTYFRVSFYGSRFGDLHNQEFVYKEHALTKLPEIFSRLENFYGQRFGHDNVVIIKDSNNVDVSTLEPDKAYIQITYVEPYFEPHELRKRLTVYERNHNIKRFMYATPFTAGGRAHGQLADQCKRKTILTTSHHFPYLKTRIQVVQRTQIILSPIEVAIEDIQKKTAELSAATQAEPADPKMLQMVVQGCIGTTVNQGPLELAQVFLAPVSEGSQPPTRLTNKLRLSFKDFSKKCHDALKKNKNLIGSDQREYQRELERNFARFTDRLAPLVKPVSGHANNVSNGVSKPDYKYQT